jgi:peptidyl-prolyl cis-trans isomerase B (cyclophilin B)
MLWFDLGTANPCGDFSLPLHFLFLPPLKIKIAQDMNKLFSFIFLLIIACGQGNSDYVITIKTSYGDMIAILYDETPLHKKNFIKLAEEKFFDSLLFHRVIQGFMIQGGDPDSKRVKPGQQLGGGGPGYNVPAEFNPKFFHEKGALSAARQGDNVNPKKESSGSQFYIVQGTVLKQADLDGLKYDQQKLMAGLRQMYQTMTDHSMFDSLNQIYASGDMQAYQNKLNSFAPRVEKATGVKVTRDGVLSPEKIATYTTVGGAPHLDGEYTVFGKVIKGLEVIDKIAAVQRDPADRPLEDIRMTVTVEEMSKKKITREFGWKY